MRIWRMLKDCIARRREQKRRRQLMDLLVILGVDPTSPAAQAWVDERYNAYYKR